MGMVPTYDVRSTASRYSLCSTPNTTIHAFRPETNLSLIINVIVCNVCMLRASLFPFQYIITTIFDDVLHCFCFVFTVFLVSLHGD